MFLKRNVLVTNISVLSIVIKRCIISSYVCEYPKLSVYIKESLEHPEVLYISSPSVNVMLNCVNPAVPDGI